MYENAFFKFGALYDFQYMKIKRNLYELTLN